MRSGRDRGAAIVWALALVSVLTIIASVVGAAGAQAIARQQLATVGDVVALAAAQAPDDPCGVASQLATANEARLESCGLDDGDVVVTVSRPPPPLVQRLLSALGRSARELTVTVRAGPPPR